MHKHLVSAVCLLPLLSISAFADDDDFVISNNPSTKRIMGFHQQPVQNEERQEETGAQVQEQPAQAAYDHHPVPATPPGWDSLTTGQMNGGGVLNNFGNDYDNGYGGGYPTANIGFAPPGMGNYPPITGQPQIQVPFGGYAHGAQQFPVMPMVNAANSNALGIAQAGGVMMTDREYAAYGNALTSLLQYALSQQGGQQGYGQLPTYGYGQAYTGQAGYAPAPAGPAANVRIRPRTSAFAPKE